MKKKILAFMPYTIALVLNFYVLPLLIKDTGTGMLMMLTVMPLVTFICAVLYGARLGFSFFLPIIAAIVFAPSIFIFYNASAWVYIIVYAMVALAGNGIGRIFYQKR